MTALALTRILRHAARLDPALAFYHAALGFQPIAPPAEDALLARLLGVGRLVVARMRLGAQELALYETERGGEAFPEKLAAHDLRFEHIAIVTSDMAAAYERVCQFAIAPLSTSGPQTLPAASGGVTAFKFYDPAGHPLELLAFPDRQNHQNLFTGFDHAAIVVADVARSVAFYQGLGLRETSRQLNHGPAQDALDALRGACTDVVALKAEQATPHLELLHYRQPAIAPVVWQPGDVRADRLVFAAGASALERARDPDGHELVLDGRAV